MFMGEFQHSLDVKGRVIIPSKFREMLGESFVLTIGLDQCLSGYPMSEWKLFCEKLNSLPVGQEKSRQFNRLIFSRATTGEFDKQGRINIPDTLKAYAKLDKDCVIIGVSDRFEIWDKAVWEKYFEEGATPEELSETLNI